MKINVDREADALYFHLSDDSIRESEEIAPGLVLDYNERGEVVGFEMLGLSRRASAPDLKKLEFQTV